MTIPAAVAHAVQQTQEWLKELRDNADLADETEAWSVLGAVLHHLRDRLTVDETSKLAAQLPMLVRGSFYDGWRPADVPDTSIRNRQAFLDTLRERMLPRRVDPELAATAVFTLIAHHLDPGVITNVIAQLPDDIRGLWPRSARTFKERMR